MTKSKGTMIARSIGCCATFTAAVVMLFAVEELPLFAGKPRHDPPEIKFSQWDCFKYFVVANFFGFGYNIIVLFYPSGSMLWPLIFALDVIMSMMLGTSSIAAWMMYSFMKHGDVMLGWSPICHVVGDFCNKLYASIIMGLIGFCISFVLLLYSLHVIVNPLQVPENS